MYLQFSPLVSTKLGVLYLVLNLEQNVQHKLWAWQPGRFLCCNLQEVMIQWSQFLVPWAAQLVLIKADI